MDKQQKVDVTIDYIRNKTEGIPDEFLPQIGMALQEGIKLGEEDMLRKVIAKLADFNSDMARLYLTGLRTSLSQMTIDLVKLENLLKEE